MRGSTVTPSWGGQRNSSPHIYQGPTNKMYFQAKAKNLFTRLYLPIIIIVFMTLVLG